MKYKDLGADSDSKLPAIPDAIVEPIPAQEFEVGNRVQNRKTLEVRRVKKVDNNTLTFEPNGVTDEASNWVVMADTPDKLTDATIHEQSARQAASHPINANNRDYANAQAYILQTASISPLTHLQREYLAEAYATTGDYEKAVKTTRDKLKRAEWKAVHKAIWKSDDETCDCDDTKTVIMVKGKVTPVTHSRMFTVGQVFSHKLNKMVRLVRCNKCGGDSTVDG